MSCKVLLVFSSSHIGGAERSLTLIARAADGPVRFEVATLDGPGPWVDWCQALGMSPVVLGNAGPSSARARFGLRALLRFIRLVRTQGYAAIYVIGARAALAVRLLKPWLGGAGVVQGVRWNPSSDSALDRVFRSIEARFSRLIDLYVCNSRAAAETLIRDVHVPVERVRVIYNGVEVAPAPPPPHASRPFHVLTIATLSPRKGHLGYLEHVVAPLSQRWPNVRFVLVGRDEMAGAVERQVARLGLSEVVACTGFRPDVSTFLNAARVLVLPSLRNEGCPTAIMEAMAHAVPTVSFEIDGIPELVEHGREGLLIRVGDYPGMRAAIERLLSDSATAEALGRHGREKVLSRFTVEVAAAEHVRVFATLGGRDG